MTLQLPGLPPAEEASALDDHFQLDIQLSESEQALKDDILTI